MSIVKRSEIEEVEMDLTSLCNLHCYICTRNFLHSQHMLKHNIRPLKDILAQLDTFSGLKRFFIAGAMSEPTLHPQFLDFIKYLNSRDIYYELFTNGNTHDISWWEELGKLVPSKCMTCFTVCGSTQELHEYYRVGSSLQQILDNAAAYRKNGKKNDWVQHILFEYNKEDYQSGKMHNIFSQFSHSFQVHSEGRRRNNEKVIDMPTGIMPPKKVNVAIDYIFSKMPQTKSNMHINCTMETQKKIYIDQFGNIFPCYTYAENGYPPFDNDAQQFDLTKVCQHEYADCYLCSDVVRKQMDMFKLQFIR